MLTVHTRNRQCTNIRAQRNEDGSVSGCFTDICCCAFRLTAAERFTLEKQGYLLQDSGYPNNPYVFRLS